MNRVLKTLKNVLPFVVSAAILAFLLVRFDVGAALGHVTARTAIILVPALLVYGAISLYVDALTLVRVFVGEGRALDLVTAARIKAASYLLALLHYTLGAGSVAVLMRRHTGIPLADSGGMVLLVAVFDLLVLILIAASGTTVVASLGVGVQTGVIAVALLGVAGGLALLRAPFELGPLERLRTLTVFRVAREAPLLRLASVAGLRAVFVVCFVSIGWVSLLSFGVSPPLADTAVGMSIVALVAALPIAVSGLGTAQAAFVFVFRDHAAPDLLLACSLAMSLGLILMRAVVGFLFAGEYTREAMTVAREVEA